MLIGVLWKFGKGGNDDGGAGTLQAMRTEQKLAQ